MVGRLQRAGPFPRGARAAAGGAGRHVVGARLDDGARRRRHAARALGRSDGRACRHRPRRFHPQRTRRLRAAHRLAQPLRRPFAGAAERAPRRHGPRPRGRRAVARERRGGRGGRAPRRASPAAGCGGRDRAGGAGRRDARGDAGLDGPRPCGGDAQHLADVVAGALDAGAGADASAARADARAHARRRATAPEPRHEPAWTARRRGAAATHPGCAGRRLRRVHRTARGRRGGRHRTARPAGRADGAVGARRSARRVLRAGAASAGVVPLDHGDGGCGRQGVGGAAHAASADARAAGHHRTGPAGGALRRGRRVRARRHGVCGAWRALGARRTDGGVRRAYG